MNSVKSWTNDVNQVNSFLNTASTLSGADLAAAAQTAFGFASDEPVQLMFEAGLPGLSQDGLNAAADLMQVFQVGVLDQLQNIINDPTNSDMVQASCGYDQRHEASACSARCWISCGQRLSLLSTSAPLLHQLSAKPPAQPSQAQRRLKHARATRHFGGGNLLEWEDV